MFFPFLDAVPRTTPRERRIMREILGFDPQATALHPLSHTDNAAGATATVDSGLFAPATWLLIHVRIAGYSASGVARLQFNGDTGSNYNYTASENQAAVVTGGAGAAGILVAAVAQTTARALCSFWVRNILAQVKGVVGIGNTGSEAVGTAPAYAQVAGIWVNTSAQINRVVLDVGTGGGTLTAGTSLDVFGVNS